MCCCTAVHLWANIKLLGILCLFSFVNTLMIPDAGSTWDQFGGFHCYHRGSSGCESTSCPDFASLPVLLWVLLLYSIFFVFELTDVWLWIWVWTVVLCDSPATCPGCSLPLTLRQLRQAPVPLWPLTGYGWMYGWMYGWLDEWMDGFMYV